MSKSKLIVWPYLQHYLEAEYVDEFGKSPYTDSKKTSFTFEYVMWVIKTNNVEIEEDALREWYNAEIVNKVIKAPEIFDFIPRVMNVYFIKEYKFFFNKNNKKTAADYILNIDKIIEEKMQCAPPVVFNNVQIFMLNYEIKKSLDKAITIVTEKYDNIVCINSGMSENGIVNIVGHLRKEYPEYEFNYVILDKDNELDGLSDRHDELLVVNHLF